MTKGTKITIGILATLAIGGLVTWLVVKNRKPKAEEDWDASEDGGNKETTTPIDAETRQANNFAAVKKYFGSSASIYNNRVVVTKSTKFLAQTINQPASIFGLTDSEITVVYWENGQFTVKINGVKAALKGYYYKGGTVIKVSGGQGKFASKAGLREEDSNILRAITRAILK